MNFNCLTYNKQNNKTLVILTLVMIVFVDTLALSITFTLLPDLFLSANGIFKNSNTPESTRNLLYGLSLSLPGIVSFFGMPFLGDLSDRFGRKPIFLAGLLGVALTYILSIIAIHIQCVTLFIFSRIIAGAFAGTSMLACSAMADISGKNTKTRSLNIRWPIIATLSGYTIGPIFAMTGYLTPRYFNFITPFVIASGLTSINIIMLLLFFNETLKTSKKVRLSFLKSIGSVYAFCTDKRLRFSLTLIVFCLIPLGIFLQYLPLILTENSNFTVSGLGYYFIAMNAVNALTAAFILPPLVKRYTTKSMIRVSFVISGIMVASCGFIPGIFGFLSSIAITGIWVATMIKQVSGTIAYIGLTTEISNTVGDDEQGKYLGTFGGIFVLIISLAALIDSFGTKYSPLILTAAGICYFIGVILSLRFRD